MVKNLLTLLAFKTFNYTNKEIMQFIDAVRSLYREKSEYGIAVLDPETDEGKAWFMFECAHSSSSE